MNALVKLGDLPLSRVVIISIMVTGLYYLVGFDSGESFKLAMTASEQSKIELNTEIVKIDKELEEINQLKTAQERDAERLNTLLGFIPEKLTKTELMRTLGNEAKSVGVGINQIRDSSGSSKKSEFYDEVGVEVELAGSFSQLLLFLANLTSLNQILSVDSLTINSAGSLAEGSNLIMSATILGYRYAAKTPAVNQ